MLSNKNTLRSSTSTLVTGTITHPVSHFNQEDIKVVFVKNKKNKKNSVSLEKKQTLDEDDGHSYKSVIRSNRKYTSKNNNSREFKFEGKKVHFKDEIECKTEDSRRLSRLAEIYIVPSYKNFYNKVFLDEDDKNDKAGCKCSCIIY